MAHGVGIGRRGRDDLPLNAEINVTSLVDVAFTLLVIFIITAPILQGGVDVNLPTGDVQPVTTLDDQLIISVDAEGRVYLSETEVSLDELRQSLGQMIDAGGIDQIFLRGDRSAVYGTVMEVIMAANASGVTIALIAEPERR